MSGTFVLQIRDTIIERGLEEVQHVYAEDSPERLGGVEGFELCRSLSTPEAYQYAIAERHAQERELRDPARRSDPDHRNQYWRHRYATLQVEFVYERLRILWGIGSEMVSARAMMQLADIAQEYAKGAS